MTKFSQSEEKAQEGKGEENKSVETKPYNVFGSDYVVSEAEFISYQKFRMKMMIMKFKLVGRMDTSGNYVISDSVKKDLVKMEKEIEDKTETYYKAIALFMKKHFYYTVTIKTLNNGMARASLYLSEWVDDFLDSNYIVTHIADFEANHDSEFDNKVRKAFHLVDVNVKIDDTAVPEIAVSMQEAFDFELIEGGLYDMACQIYVLNLLKLLESGGKQAHNVLARYRKLLSENDVEINEKYRYIGYKSLLDRAIDEMGGFKKLNLDKARLEIIIRELNKTLLHIDTASNRGPIETMKTNPQNGSSKSGNKSAKKPQVAGQAKKDKPNTDKKGNTSQSQNSYDPFAGIGSIPSLGTFDMSSFKIEIDSSPSVTFNRVYTPIVERGQTQDLSLRDSNELVGKGEEQAGGNNNNKSGSEGEDKDLAEKLAEEDESNMAQFNEKENDIPTYNSDENKNVYQEELSPANSNIEIEPLSLENE